MCSLSNVSFTLFLMSLSIFKCSIDVVFATILYLTEDALNQKFTFKLYEKTNNRWKQIDSVNNVMGYLGLVMPFAVSAFGIFLMRQAFLKIPREVEEAAIIDGCNVFQMFIRVVIPMVKPTLAVLAVFTFIGSWGEFLWPSIMLTKDSMYTLPVGINNLQGMFSANWRYIAAGSILSTIPIIIFFLAMQRYFISGENDGAVKG